MSPYEKQCTLAKVHCLTHTASRQVSKTGRANSHLPAKHCADIYFIRADNRGPITRDQIRHQILFPSVAVPSHRAGSSGNSANSESCCLQLIFSSSLSLSCCSSLLQYYLFNKFIGVRHVVLEFLFYYKNQNMRDSIDFSYLEISFCKGP